jgi:hypothetical protein
LKAELFGNSPAKRLGNEQVFRDFLAFEQFAPLLVDSMGKCMNHHHHEHRERARKKIVTNDREREFTIKVLGLDGAATENNFEFSVVSCNQNARKVKIPS